VNAMKALKIDTENKFSVVDVEEPLYRDLKTAIGRRVEVVHPRGLARPFIMIVDEEGIIKQRPVNTIGSFLYGAHIQGNVIAGDIVIIREADGEDGPDFVGLLDQDIEALTYIFQGLKYSLDTMRKLESR